MNHGMLVCSNSRTLYVVETQVVLDRKDLLDGLFDGPDAVGAFELRDCPLPEAQVVHVSVCCVGVHE